jgi:hypothetical protein
VRQNAGDTIRQFSTDRQRYKEKSIYLRKNMTQMKIIIIGISLFLLYLTPINAQETAVVRGILKYPNVELSATFDRNLFAFMKGDYIMPKYDNFCTFEVDSVISGEILNFENEINKTPLKLIIGVFNECTILNFDIKYTLKIKQFPNTNYYYIENLNQVYNNEQYADKLLEYREKHEQAIKILKEGTAQEKKDFLDKTIQNNYNYADYRYVKYILPYMTSKDTINYSYDVCIYPVKTETYWDKMLFSKYLNQYLGNFFSLPKQDDNINWEEWYNKKLNREHFPTINYTNTQQKTIISGGGLSYFVPDTKNGTIHIKIPFVSDAKKGETYINTGDKYYLFDIQNDELQEKTLEKGSKPISYFPDSYGIYKDEISYYSYPDISRAKLINGIYCQQAKIPFEHEKKDYYVRTTIIIPCNNGSNLIFWNEIETYQNDVKAGRIDKKGKWEIVPHKLFGYNKFGYTSHPLTGSFSYLQLNDNKNIVVFSAENYDKEDSGTIFLYKVNEKLDVEDSTSFFMDFPRFDYSFCKTYLLQKDSTFLLVAKVHHNGGNELYYKIIGQDLTPKTAFILLANELHTYEFANPIVTSNGFLITWVDDDIAENNLRSVLINTSGEQSNIINITNQRVNKIYNVEYNTENVDIYMYNNDAKKLIRKRISTKEYLSKEQ